MGITGDLYTTNVSKSRTDGVGKPANGQTVAITRVTANLRAKSLVNQPIAAI
jgi:hypothetical protein